MRSGYKPNCGTYLVITKVADEFKVARVFWSLGDGEFQWSKVGVVDL